MCDNCGKDIDGECSHYIRLQVWGRPNEEHLERRFCSVDCLKEYIEGWDEGMFLLYPSVMKGQSEEKR